MDTVQCDVVVIGGGVTGLTAAAELAARGTSVVVLEARNRVGGRLWTDSIDGQVREIGGQWVSPDQNALLRLLDDLGLETFERYRAGDGMYLAADGSARRFAGTALPFDAATAAEFDRLADEVSALAAEIDPAAPWEHPSAAEWDRLSFRAWLDSRSDDKEAVDNIALFVAEAMLTKPAHAFSLLQALLMAASAGGFQHLLDADFILDRRVIGGLQSVALGLAKRLGDAVRLGQPVSRLEWTADRVTASTEHLRVVARRALVAVPPNLYDRIAYDPPLPRHRRQLHQHLSLGLVIKVHATYATPFWRDAGLSGTAFSPYQLVHEAYDNTNHGDERGTLVGFVSDERADHVLALPADERKARILASLAAYFGDAVLAPLTYYESDWASEEWTGGAFGASYDLGGLRRYGPAQHQPVGSLWFGSSDLAGLGYQHVDGAIRVGIARAAALTESLAAPERGVA